MEDTKNTEKGKWEGNLTDIAQYADKVIETPVFLIFAEYLGYVSKFVDEAEKWCDGKIPERYIQKIMMMESKTIFHQMKKDYGIDTIKYWYNTYYPVILNEYVESLEKVIYKKD